jgi:hypothetical protein
MFKYVYVYITVNNSGGSGDKDELTLGKSTLPMLQCVNLTGD